MLQPVLVRPIPGGTYELIAGERRWRAAQLAELETIPAIVRYHDDAASLEVALIENMAREDLNPVEEARACAALTEELGLSREEVGDPGRPQPGGGLQPDPPARPARRGARPRSSAGELSEGHGRALLLATDHDDRRRLARAAVDGGWSVRELEDRARRANGGRRAARPPARRTPPPAASRPGGGDGADHRRFGPRLGREVEVTATAGGGYRVHLSFDSALDALELADRLGPDERIGRPGCAAASGAPLESPRHGRLAQSVRALL